MRETKKNCIKCKRLIAIEEEYCPFCKCEQPPIDEATAPNNNKSAGTENNAGFAPVGEDFFKDSQDYFSGNFAPLNEQSPSPIADKPQTQASAPKPVNTDGKPVQSNPVNTPQNNSDNNNTYPQQNIEQPVNTPQRSVNQQPQVQQQTQAAQPQMQPQENVQPVRRIQPQFERPEATQGQQEQNMQPQQAQSQSQQPRQVQQVRQAQPRQLSRPQIISVAPQPQQAQTQMQQAQNSAPNNMPVQQQQVVQPVSPIQNNGVLSEFNGNKNAIKWTDEEEKPILDMSKIINEDKTYNPNFDGYYDEILPRVENELDMLVKGKEKTILKAVFFGVGIIALIIYLILTI